MSIKISVVIPVYNAETMIVGCLESILKQSVLPDEVIVVDNGSSDRTYDIVKKYIDNNRTSLKAQIVKEEKKGAAAARNKGISMALSDIIVFTDSDCLAFPNWI